MLVRRAFGIHYTSVRDVLYFEGKPVNFVLEERKVLLVKVRIAYPGVLSVLANVALSDCFYCLYTSRCSL